MYDLEPQVNIAKSYTEGLREYGQVETYPSTIITFLKEVLEEKYEKALTALRMIKGDRDPYNDGQYHSQEIWTAARALRELEK